MLESGESADNAAALSNDEAMANGKQKYRGRLELTWTNKDEALLSREDGSYEWVPKRDHRVAEVRLLRDAGTVGEVHPEAERAKDNLLIRGDALHALTALNSLPEFAAEYAGKVKLVYIDPPFNTGQAFAQYDDGLEHSVWLTMMRDRLEQIADLLTPDGSVWVHLDDAEMAYCRVAMDAIFGRENFVATIVWQRRDGRPNDAIIGQAHDYILVFAKDITQFARMRNRLVRTEGQEAAYQNPDDDPRGPWRNDNYTSNKSKDERPNSWFPIVRPADGAEIWPKPHAVWRYSPERHAQNVAEERLWWGAHGLNNMPKLKRFRSEVEGIVPMTWWPFTECGSTRNAKDELKKLFPGAPPFATPKPERLMERVITIASNPGDIVLDCFAGSGSTAAVAHKMGRRWVTCELSHETLDTFTAPRLEKVVKGEDAGGISAIVEWEGGGGFRVLDVAPSMYEEDAGVVVLADWAENSKLAEVVAAQLGFTYVPDPPFHGQHGRMRLAVIDGHLDEAVVRLLLRALPEGQRLSLAATSLDPEAAALLAKLKSGSQARVVPQDILLSYRTPSAWRAAVAKPEPEAPDASGQPTDAAPPSEEGSVSVA